MIQTDKCIVMDLDGTICPIRGEGENYEDLVPLKDVVEKLCQYRNADFHIILHTSRSMRTYGGNVGLINANTARSTLEWLDRHKVPYDEIHFGKPWAGHRGFYVDDRSIRPSEFLRLSYEEILALIAS